MVLELRRFTIRRKLLRLFGAAFYVVDEQGRQVAFCKQKAFRLREDIRLYADESMGETLLTIAARQVLDFSAAYDVHDAQRGEKVGALRRKGWSSIVRDAWEVLDADDLPIARITEDSTALAIVRRLLTRLVPQTFHARDDAGRPLATFRVHFNPILYRMSAEVTAPELDPRLVVGAALLIAAIEGRQD